MTVVVRPAPNLWIKMPNEVFCRTCRMGLDKQSGILQENFDIALGGFYQKFALVLAYIKPKEIKSLIYMRDLGFLYREFQSTLLQEGCHNGHDFVFQHFFRCASNHKIIGIRYHMYFV